MNGDAVLQRIRDVGVIPVIRADSDATALNVASALIDAGLTIVEITMTVPGALAVVASLARRFGSAVLLGAGTITSPEMAKAAIEAGSEFLVTPCVLPDVIAAARARRAPILCGALTPTEVFSAREAGADMVKVFPAQAVGGSAYVRALNGPFPEIEIVPTGGVNLQNVGDYIRAGAAAVGAGGELVLKEWVAAGDFRAIGTLGRKFIEAVQDARR